MNFLFFCGKIVFSFFFCAKIQGNSSILPLFFKKFSNMSLFWNYLGQCPYFETRFSQNRVSMKKSIALKSSYAQSNLKIKIKNKK